LNDKKIKSNPILKIINSNCLNVDEAIIFFEQLIPDVIVVKIEINNKNQIQFADNTRTIETNN